METQNFVERYYGPYFYNMYVDDYLYHNNHNPSMVHFLSYAACEARLRSRFTQIFQRILSCQLMSVFNYFICQYVHMFNIILTHLLHQVYPSIFSDLSAEQIRAARTFLSQPIEESKSRLTRRIFNLDASKVL